MRAVKVLMQGMIFTLSSLVTVTIARAQQTSVVDSALMQRVEVLEQLLVDHNRESHFMVAGLTTFGFVHSSSTFTPVNGVSQTTKTNSFADADHYELSPMFLWRHGTKFLVEFEPSFDGTALGVNWANISYFATPGLIVRAGYFVLPFGIYNKRLAAGWIDKVATDPNGIDLPGTDFGIGISGGLPLGNMKWSYDFSLTNGMQLLPNGQLQNAGVVDNNTNKTITGRLGLLPFANSSLEIGVSGLYGGVADAGSNYNNAKTSMFGADLNFVKTFDPFLINVKGQYSKIKVNSQSYLKPTDSTAYTFDNTTTSTFGQISIRPTGIDNAFVKNLELVYRHVDYKTPGNSLWGQNFREEDIGLDYWLNWRTVLKFTYTSSHSLSTANISAGGIGGVTDTKNIYLQFAIEF